SVAAELETLNKLGDELRATLNAELGAHGFSISGFGSLLHLHGTSAVPRSWGDVCASDQDAVREVQRKLRDRGIYIAPRGLVVLSTAHPADELSALKSAWVDACRNVA